jgi:deoxyribonucleoside regulator
MSVNRLDLLAQVATWYHEEGLGQAAIARRIGRSRSLVSRLLLEARQQGLVEIRVHYPLKTDFGLEERLRQTFGLTQCWVLADPPSDYASLLRRLGELGARYLQHELHDGVTVGVTWGTAIYEVVRAMPSLPLRDTMVVQMIGSIGYGDPVVDGPELARWLAQKMNATHRFVPAPLIVENADIAQALLQERTIAETLALAGRADVMLVGVGTVDSEFSSLRRTGYVGETDLADLRQAGAVGDLLARQLDAEGRTLDIPFNRRVIGIQNLESLRSIPTVMAVAGGAVKVPAILAALRGRYFNTLVTDASTASRVLSLQGER